MKQSSASIAWNGPCTISIADSVLDIGNIIKRLEQVLLVWNNDNNVIDRKIGHQNISIFFNNDLWGGYCGQVFSIDIAAMDGSQNITYEFSGCIILRDFIAKCTASYGLYIVTILIAIE